MSSSPTVNDASLVVDPRFGQKNVGLLRLFKSQFFTAWMAVTYLFKYAENTGIQDYLCQELRKFSVDESIQYLPQLCHIMIAHPKMMHLEQLIIDLCRVSTHFSLMALWYFEAYLSDLEDQPHTLSFYVCTRIMQTVEKIILVRDDEQVEQEAQALSVSLHKKSSTTKPHLQMKSSHSASSPKGFHCNTGSNPSEMHSNPLRNIKSSSPSIEDLHQGKAFSFSNFVARVTSLPPFSTRPASAASVRPTSPPEPARSQTPSHLHHGNSSADQRMLERYYYHSELQFITTLASVSERLVAVPREARQSTLTAELTLLNHNLPASVCIPLWCRASDTCKHHQIVRISPTDATVLNSADRVPYLLFIEVIEEDPTTDKQHNESVESPQARVRRRSSLSLLLASAPVSPIASIASPLEPITCQEPIETSLQENSATPNVPATSSKIRIVDDFEDQMRTAAILLAQLALKEEQALAAEQVEASKKKKPHQQKKSANLKMTEMIRSRIFKQMMELEEARVAKLHESGILALNDDSPVPIGELAPTHDPHATASSSQNLDSFRKRQVSMPSSPIRTDKDDPSSAVVRETWERKRARIKASSPYGSHRNWNLISMIVKSGADLRQEQLACQLIGELSRVWRNANVGCWVFPYQVLVTGFSHGFVQTVPNTISIHSIKKDAYARFGDLFTLKDFFINEFGSEGSESFLTAQNNFMESLAGYSILSYVLNVKDRHNGNILLDLTNGRVVHIDFGFMLSNSPGLVGFETAPFKFSQEYADLLGGFGSTMFREWRNRMISGFLALRRDHEKIIGLVEIMEVNSPLDCFSYTSLSKMNGASVPVQAADGSFTTQDTPASPSKMAVSAALRERLLLTLTDSQVADFVDRLIASSMSNVFTKLYDGFQYYTQGIMA